MKQFRLVDNVMGWLAFAIAAFVYCCTIEPTASFWDCPEFILTGYKLEIGHPPGAPFFMLTANLLSQFVSDPSEVARMVNTMSALLSAACILFLFWTITHLVRRLILKDWSELNLGKLIAIEASGMVGALIYTFSDTFWFSAVEGEVYAYSSAFTAVVFWLILKWEDHADEPHSDRWLVLITYMTGLSIGVHLLNLLCIPAIVLVWYYKKNPDANLKGSLLALLVSFVIVAAVLYGVVPGIITVGGWFELFFVNTLGMPFNTGVIIYIALLVATVIWAIYESYQGKNELRANLSFILSIALIGIPFYGYGWGAFITGLGVIAVLTAFVMIKRKGAPLISHRVKNTSLLCMLMLMIGYSTYALIVIRSSANPPMDQNSPEDIFTLGNYLSRDQYGDRPLFFGQAYTSEVKYEPVDDQYQRPVYVEEAPIYEKKEKASKDEKDSYFVAGRKGHYVYAENMFFPRMYDRAHTQDYEAWMGGVSKTQTSTGGQLPTMGENIRFFLSYQCNFMYWRYFMWNFAGRQNDIQGHGELEHGNWITGISFIDNAMYGDQSKLPDELKENKGHNVFYALPLLLGLIGLFWQAYRGKRGIQQFWVVFFLFFMTGLAIVVYLNQTPVQPRERDYAYAGSFYAYAIWCGIGVAAIIDLLKKLKLNGTLVSAVVGLATLAIPIQMASQTWDDHDRSGRYTCRDFGQNYLMSLQETGNPIIYTNGDNDTFPLWYNQEVEGVRTDARVCNLSYLATDWYIDQMRRPAYESPSVPITWPRLDYVTGTNDYVEVAASQKSAVRELYAKYPDLFPGNPLELKNVLKLWVRQDLTDAQWNALREFSGDPTAAKESFHFIPTDTLLVTIDKEAVRKSGMMMATDSIPDQMVISLGQRKGLMKSDLMMLEMIANCNWTRPIYVAITVGQSNYMNLGDNFIQEGLVNRISPFTTNKPGAKRFDTETTYKNVMTRFKWGGLRTKGLYLDETVMRMCWTHRHLMATLATQLIAEKKNDKALKVLEKAEKEIPVYNVPMTYRSGGLQIAHCYLLLGKQQKANAIMEKLWKDASQYMDWYLSLNQNRFMQSQQECLDQISCMQMMLQMTDGKPEYKKWFDTHYALFEKYINAYEQHGGRMPGQGDEEEEAYEEEG